MTGTPVASTSKVTERPLTQKQKTSRARKDIEPNKGADNGDGESSQSDYDDLPSPLYVSTPNQFLENNNFTLNPVVLLEKINVPALDNSAMSQDSDNF